MHRALMYDLEGGWSGAITAAIAELAQISRFELFQYPQHCRQANNLRVDANHTMCSTTMRLRYLGNILLSFEAPEFQCLIFI